MKFKEEECNQIKIGTCPECGQELKIIYNKGKNFIGCNNYPRCNFSSSFFNWLTDKCSVDPYFIEGGFSMRKIKEKYDNVVESFDYYYIHQREYPDSPIITIDLQFLRSYMSEEEIFKFITSLLNNMNKKANRYIKESLIEKKEFIEKELRKIK